MPIGVSRSICLIVVAMVMTWVSSVNASVTWPAIEPPPESRVAWVGKNMKLNGVPVQIQHFSSDLSQREVLDFYRSRWGSASRDSVSQPNDNVVAAQFGNFSFRVQVQPAKPRGSQGFIAVTMLPSDKTPPKPGADFPRLGGSKVLTDVESIGDGKLAKLLILNNRFSVASNVSYYETTMSQQGWRQLTDHGGPQAGGRAYEMFFQRGDHELNIIINKTAGGTAITANIVTNHLDSQ